MNHHTNHKPAAAALLTSSGQHRRHCRLAFSLLEILVVIAIITILIGIIVPVLGVARTATHRAQCANNQRQIAMIARVYAADFRDYLGQANALDYKNGSDINNGKSLPGEFTKAGFTNPLTSQGDHYLALGYLPLTTTYQGLPGSDLYLCPSVQKTYAAIDDNYWQGKGNVESHYFYSTLLTRPTITTSVRKRRNNVWGPYRSNQILQPGDTIFAGDAMGYTDPGDPSAPAAMVDTWNWDQIGENSTIFGVSATSVTSWLESPAPFHRGGPNALFYDGHVRTMTQPTPDQRYQLRPQFTANYSGIKE